MASTKKQIEWAIREWRRYADRERHIPAKNTALKVIKSLELELLYDEPHCSCHLEKLKDCPKQLQNRNTLR
jgi:hypothetical protein